MDEEIRCHVEYVLFDMDGLMIDSERIYTVVTISQQATLDISYGVWYPTPLPDQILAKFGKEMTWEMKAGCMGKPELEAANHLLAFFPDISLDIPTYLKERNILQDQLWPTVPLLPGVQKLVHHLKKHNVPIAIATGSRRRNYELKTKHLQDVFACFEEKVICGDDHQYKAKGKPAPDVFIVAAQELLGRDVGDADSVPNEAQLRERQKGLVLEDGLPGMLAGKRAGMRVLWVPDPNLLDHAGTSGPETADQVLRSLEDFRPEQWGLPAYSKSDK